MTGSGMLPSPPKLSSARGVTAGMTMASCALATASTSWLSGAGTGASGTESIGPATADNSFVRAPVPVVSKTKVRQALGSPAFPAASTAHTRQLPA